MPRPVSFDSPQSCPHRSLVHLLPYHINGARESTKLEMLSAVVINARENRSLKLLTAGCQPVMRESVLKKTRPRTNSLTASGRVGHWRFKMDKQTSKMVGGKSFMKLLYVMASRLPKFKASPRLFPSTSAFFTTAAESLGKSKLFRGVGTYPKYVGT